MLRFDGFSLAERLVVETGDWAESAVLGRFEVGPDGLYQLRTDQDGFSVVRFDIGGGL